MNCVSSLSSSKIRSLIFQMAAILVVFSPANMTKRRDFILGTIMRLYPDLDLNVRHSVKTDKIINEGQFSKTICQKDPYLNITNVTDITCNWRITLKICPSNVGQSFSLRSRPVYNGHRHGKVPCIFFLKIMIFFSNLSHLYFVNSHVMFSVCIEILLTMNFVLVAFMCRIYQ